MYLQSEKVAFEVFHVQIKINFFVLFSQRNQRLTSGNPCPICRDIYLVVDYRNTDLLKQFISPHTGAVIHWDKTGVCRTQQERLLIEIERAKDIGTITFDVIFREYDYSEYEKIYASY